MQDSLAQLRAHLVGQLVARGADLADAEDCVQEALLKLWMTQRGESPPVRDQKSWLAVVARRRLADLHRDRSRLARAASRHGALDTPAVDDAVLDRAQARWLLRSLAEMPSTSGEVVELIGQGRSVDEAADELGLTRRSVQSHLTRVRRLLRVRAALGWAVLAGFAASFARTWRSLCSQATAVPVAVAAAVVVLIGVDPLVSTAPEGQTLGITGPAVVSPAPSTFAASEASIVEPPAAPAADLIPAPVSRVPRLPKVVPPTPASGPAALPALPVPLVALEVPAVAGPALRLPIALVDVVDLTVPTG